MAETDRLNNPGGIGPSTSTRLAPVRDVRELQRKLWAAARAVPERCFHTL